MNGGQPIAPRRVPFTIFPFILAAVGLTIAALPWVRPGADMRREAQPAAAAAEAGFSLPPLASLTATLERPLFESLRRAPVKPTAGTNEAAPLVLGRYRLLGIVSSGGKRSAVLLPVAGGSSRLIMAGEALEDWLVAAVGEGDLTLRRGGDSQTVSLRRQTSP